MNRLKRNIPVKYLYLISAFVLVIMSLVLYSTYAMFTVNTTSSNIANLEVGATYEFTINGIQTFTIGQNSKASFNMSVKNSASGSIYYEMYYSSSDSLTNVTIAELVTNKTVTTTAPNTSGNLTTNQTKVVPIVIVNNTSSTKTITVGVTSGFVGNTITYGSNGYPQGTKITSTYNIGDTTTGCETVDISTCTEEIVGGNRVTNCATTSKAITVDASGANAPELASGMIPIMYTGGKWVKADSSNTNTTYKWYNYQNKLWANVALVKTNATSGVTGSKSRSQYMASAIGTEVIENDILAYYVWIPRYKYKLFNPTYASGTSPQEIDVVFENKKEITGTVKCIYADDGTETCLNKTVGNYYTHPAFTFGGTGLNGIWVGKFETTGDAEIPTIKPNELALRSQNVSTFFLITQKFGTATYLTTTGVNQVDSHIIKNIEWGAVAYLKQSRYGLGNTEIYINNSGDSSTYASYTGRSGGSANANNTTNGTYSYDGRTCSTAKCTTETINAVSLGTGSSTTGNITGIYDTSGGGEEYVMGNYQKYSGYGNSNSGYIGVNGPTSGGTPWPASKYYDLYNNSANHSSNVLGSHLGDAVGETAAWYGDLVDTVYSDRPWFRRGGRADFIAIAGIFATNYGYGTASRTDGFRSVIVRN